MPKEKEIEFVVDKLANKGMDRKLSRKNLFRCGRYFIEKLGELL